MKDVIDVSNISSHIWTLTLTIHDLASDHMYYSSMKEEIDLAFATDTICNSMRLQNYNVLISYIKSYPLNCVDQDRNRDD